MSTIASHASESGHFYDRQGRPQYRVIGKNGKERPATLRDARINGWLPGYSSIAAMEHKPMLEQWKINQALMAAITLTRNTGEDDDSFLERSRADSKEQAKKAAGKGIAIHAAIQGFYEGETVTDEFVPYVNAVRKYLLDTFGAVPWIAERSFAHELGYGGKVDLHSVKAIVDIKTKAFDEEKTVDQLAWPEMAMQLAAYSRGLGLADPIAMNIFVSTEVPGLIRIKTWDAAELEIAWSAFRCLLQLWQIRRNFFCAFTRTEAAA